MLLSEPQLAGAVQEDAAALEVSRDYARPILGVEFVGSGQDLVQLVGGREKDVADAAIDVDDGALKHGAIDPDGARVDDDDEIDVARGHHPVVSG